MASLASCSLFPSACSNNSPCNITRARELSNESQNAVSSERGGALINIEPMLEGEYVKHNDNDGHVDSADLYPQACSPYKHVCVCVCVSVCV